LLWRESVSYSRPSAVPTKPSTSTTSTASSCNPIGSPAATCPRRAPATPPQLLHHRQECLMLQVELEDCVNAPSLDVIDNQLESLRIDVIAQDGMAAWLFALSGCPRRNFVSGSFADNFPLKLGKRQQDVEHEPVFRSSPAKWTCRIS